MGKSKLFNKAVKAITSKSAKKVYRKVGNEILRKGVPIAAGLAGAAAGTAMGGPAGGKIGMMAGAAAGRAAGNSLADIGGRNRRRRLRRKGNPVNKPAII